MNFKQGSERETERTVKTENMDKQDGHLGGSHSGSDPSSQNFMT